MTTEAKTGLDLYRHYGPKSTPNDAVQAFVDERYPGASWFWLNERRGLFRPILPGHPVTMIVSIDHDPASGELSWIVVDLRRVR